MNKQNLKFTKTTMTRICFGLTLTYTRSCSGFHLLKNLAYWSCVSLKWLTCIKSFFNTPNLACFRYLLNITEHLVRHFQYIIYNLFEYTAVDLSDPSRSLSMIIQVSSRINPWCELKTKNKIFLNEYYITYTLYMTSFFITITIIKFPCHQIAFRAYRPRSIS